MGHGCRICGRIKPNEAFSGKGHKTHICKVCQKRPKAERERIDLEVEIRRFLEQSRISPKNRQRLGLLMEHTDPALRELAAVVRQVSLIAEGRRKRWKRVRATDPALLAQCVILGLVAERGDGDQEFESDDEFAVEYDGTDLAGDPF